MLKLRYNKTKLLIYFFLIILLSSITFFYFFNAEIILERDILLSEKISTHEHYRVGGNIDEFIQAMDFLNISKALFVPTGLGPDNIGYKENMAELIEIQKKYPDRVIAFCTVDEADNNAPNVFNECLKKGGKGLKLIGGHPNFYDIPLNNSVVNELVSIANKNKVPVLVHVSLINLPNAANEFEYLLNKYPNVTFIWAHYCSSIFKGVNTEKCVYYLDNYPNLYIDISMGGGIKRYFGYLERNPEKIRDFIIKYQDRMLWGADIILDDSSYKDKDWFIDRIECDFKIHLNKYFECRRFMEDPKLINGVYLPKDVLEKIYLKNPKKVLNI